VQFDDGEVRMVSTRGVPTSARYRLAAALVSKKRAAILASWGSAFLAFGMYQLSERAGGLAECLADGIEARSRIGMCEPVILPVGSYDDDRQVLMFPKARGEGPQGPEHTVLVNDLDLFVHGSSSSPDTITVMTSRRVVLDC
jgi:hypothetical protein